MSNPRYTRLSGLEPLVITPELLFVNVGERTNVTGSAQFKKLIKDDRYEEAVEVARQQVASGAQILDVNMDEGMIDSEKAMTRYLTLIASEPDIARIPVMVDSSKWSVIEAGLKCIQGKGVVNSISLKEGEDAFIQHARKVMRYGAATVVMAFDEDGQADTCARKVEICTRAYRILTEQVGFPPEDIIFDPNIFAVATGIEDHDNYAVDFIEATRIIKQTLPHCHVSGGVSNVSFSFRGNEPVRQAIHSVFLFHAIRAGMDMGIVNAGAMPIYDDLDPELRERVEDVILNRRKDSTERLLELAERYKGKKGQSQVEDLAWRDKPVHARLSHALVHGIDQYVETDTEEARAAVDAATGCHRRAFDGRHERGRRPVRRRQDVPAASRKVRARDEEGGRLPAALHRSGEAAHRRCRQEQRQDHHGHGQGRRARHRQEHRRRGAGLQQLRSGGPRRDGADAGDHRSGQGGERRPGRAIGPDHAVARGNEPRGARDAAPGHDHAA